MVRIDKISAVFLVLLLVVSGSSAVALLSHAQPASQPQSSRVGPSLVGKPESVPVSGGVQPTSAPPNSIGHYYKDLILWNNTLSSNSSITQGQGVECFVYSPVWNYLYVSVGNGVIVLNATTFKQISELPISSFSSGVYDPYNGMVYLLNEYSGILYKVNGLEIVKKISGIYVGNIWGNIYAKLLYDPYNNNIYVLATERNLVYVINISDTVIAKINTTYSWDGFLIPPGSAVVNDKIYVTDYLPINASTGQPILNETIIDIINATTNTLESNITVNSIVDQLCYNPLNKYIYATAFNLTKNWYFQNSKILLINTTTNKVDSEIMYSVSESYFGIIYDSYNKNIYVSGYNSVYVLNASTNKIIANITVKSSYMFDYCQLNNYIYVITGNSISVIDSNTNTVVYISNPFVIKPSGIAFDPDNNCLYVAESNLNRVGVIDSSTNHVIANISVGSAPTGVLYNPMTHYIYVSNSGSNNVSVINPVTSKVIANINVGSSPSSMAYNSKNGYVYVVNTHNISVIGTSNVVVGTIPFWKGYYSVTSIIYDSLNNMLYLGYNAKNITVINASNYNFVCNITLGWGVNSIEGLALNPYTYNLYVSYVSYFYKNNTGFAVIDTSKNKVIYNISFPLGYQLESLIYDELNNYIYLFYISGGNYLYVINSVNNEGIGNISLPYKQGAPYNDVYNFIASSNGYIYIPFNNEGILYIIQTPLYNITFKESGLPASTTWSVTLNGTTESSNTSTITFLRGNGTYSFTVPPVGNFNATPSSGSVVVNGNNVTVNIFFKSTEKYPITFTEVGLPAGTVWSVTLNGTTLSSSNSTIVFNMLNGTYSYKVNNASGGSGIQYAPKNSTGTVLVSGSAVKVNVVFIIQYYLTVIISPQGGGTVTSGSGWYNSGSSVTLTAVPNKDYRFISWSGSGTGSYSGTNNPASIVMTSPITETANFQAYYNVTFIESGLPAGTEWSITLSNNQTYATGGNNITVNLPQGNYSYTAKSSNPIYSGASGSFYLNRSMSISVEFHMVTYTVTFTEIGLPSNTVWSITFNNQTV